MIIRGGENIAPSAVERALSALSAGDTLGDLLAHPAFAGFAERLLPRAGRNYDLSLPLGDLGRLLPYHSAVDPGAVLSGLNHMIEEAARGLRIFFEIYSDAEKTADPDKAHSGLFLLRGRRGAPFAVIAPGGGFSYVASVHEGFPYAERISERGYNAFVVTYRAGRGGQAATTDLARAVDYILDNAVALGVSRTEYSLWGSSAGARMAAYIGSHGTGAFVEDAHPKPAAVVMAYTGHSDRSEDEPPTFVVVGGRDGIAPPSVMERRVAALRAAGTEVVFRVFPDMGHGFGAGTGTQAEGWIDDAVDLWERQIETPD